MELLNNPAIKQQLSSRSFFDLSTNNDRLGVIVSIEDDPVARLGEIFQQIITNEKMDSSYYQLHNLFTHAQIVDQSVIINLVVDTIEKKIATIRDTIFDDNDASRDGNSGGIDLGIYIQIWKNYKDFSQKMYKLVKNYQQFLVDRNIKTGKISHDILSIIQICMFYDSIVGETKNNILSMISTDLTEIDHRNIEQLIDYIDSIRAFMVMKDFTKIDKEKLSGIIKTIMNQASIVNIMCAHMNNLLKSLTKKQNVVDESEYETVVANDAEKKTIRKIYKMATILSTYAEKHKLLICYSKFMQSRIIDPKYDNLELEIEIIRRISGVLGKDESQKLINAIADIINTKNANQVIHVADIKITSDEYKNLINISTKILTPIVLTKSVWKIYNTSDMEPLYPLELKCYFDIITKAYCSIYKNDYVINWQPTMGSAQFEAQLGQKHVEITCNIVQAIALTYFNNNKKPTVAKFANDTFINPELAHKIFESLIEADLISCLTTDQTDNSIYVINTQNYTGDTKIDIRRKFIEVFEVEEQVTEDNIDKKSKKSSKDAPTLDPNMSYQKFISKALKDAKNKKPGLKNVEYMKIAAQEWSIYKAQVAKLLPTKTAVKKVAAKKAPVKAGFKGVKKSFKKEESDCESDSDSEVKKSFKKEESDCDSESDSECASDSESDCESDSESESESDTETECNSDDDDDNDESAKKGYPAKKSAKRTPFQQFISDTIKNLRKESPGLSNSAYMKLASDAWTVHKNANTKR